VSPTPQITLSNRLYVPANLVDDQLLKRWYYAWEEVKYLVRENEAGEVITDEKDEPIKDRIEERKTLRTYREMFSNTGEPFIAFPRGHMDKLLPFLKMGYRDMRPHNPLGFDLRMSPRTLADSRWPDQARCAQDFLAKGFGIVEGDTGSGKTVIGTAITSKLNVTTLIISGRKRGNTQWEDEIRTHTNINELEKKLGKRLVGAYQSNKKEKWFPITIATVQSLFSTKGRRYCAENRNTFGYLMIDEVHEFGAPEFARVVGYLNTMFICGLTATVERKDRMHYRVIDMVGPVVTSGKARQMPPTVYFIQTGVEAPEWIYKRNYPNHFQWNEIMKTLIQAEERFDLIMKYVMEDIADKRTILCISERRDFIEEVHYRLKCDGYSVAYVDGRVKGKARDRIYEEFKDGKYQILCAGKVMNAMVNLPNIDCLHFLSPSNSETTTKQVYGRARRWLEGKRLPIIRDYVDSGGQLDGAARKRIALCKKEGWKIVNIGVGKSRMATGMSDWKKYAR